MITIAIGYPAEKKSLAEKLIKIVLKKKKKLEEISSWERFG